MTEQSSSSSSSSAKGPAPRMWTPKSSMSLDDFLKKYKPSTTKASTTDPNEDGWIWVCSDRNSGASKAEAKEKDVIEKGSKWLAELAAKCKAIDDDDNIPTRASKAKGASKKQRKEHAQREADLKNKLRQLGIDSGMDCGKWLFFRNGPALDGLFSSLAHSIIDGPLSKLKTPVVAIKVATVPEKTSSTPQEGQKQVICVYFLDFWSPASAKSVLECLLVDHGALPSSCKSDLYTYLDITSGHPSGLRSTEYQPKELIDPDEIEEYLAAYRESKQTVKVRSAVRDDDDDFEDEQPARKSKSASPGKARSVSPAKSKPAAPAKAKAPSPAKSPKKQVPAAEDDDGSVTEDDEEEAELRREGEARRAAKAAAAAAPSSSSSGVKRSAPSSSTTAAPAPKRKPAAPKREQF